jgi:addiction module HigA family antidote
MMTRPPPRTPHPGEMLLDWIIESGHTQSWLAEQMDSSLKHVNHIIHGKSLYSEDYAIRLGDVTDRPARFWAELRLDWVLAEAERKRRRR